MPKQWKEDMIRKFPEIIKKKHSKNCSLDMDFTLIKLKMALEKSGYMAQDKTY